MTNGPASLERRGAWVEIDLEALRHNARTLGARVPDGTAFWPVVKADAYGHGVLPIAHALRDHADGFCVATLDEAIELRQGGISDRILVLYEPPHDALALADRYQLEIAVASVEGLRVVRQHSGPRNFRIHLKLDTGMSRQGLLPEDSPHWEDGVIHLGERVAGVWTHLSDGADPETSAKQLDRFDSAVARLSSRGLRAMRHVGASAAILSGIALRYDAVRPGLALYGQIPDEVQTRHHQPTLGLHQVMSVRAKPVRLAAVPTGTPVGYGGTFVTRRTTMLATLPLGYADGVFRSLGLTDAFVLVNGTTAPIAGRVSMDGMVVDVTDVTGVDRESIFTILGSDGARTITGNEMARAAGTIPQEIVVRFAQRLPYHYL